MAFAAIASVAGPVLGHVLGGGSGGGGSGGGGAGSAALDRMAGATHRATTQAFVGDTSRPFTGDPADPTQELTDRTLAALTNLVPDDPQAALGIIAKELAEEATKDQQIGVQDEPIVTAQAPEAPKVTAAPSVEGTEYKVIEQEEEEEEEIPVPETGSFLS